MPYVILDGTVIPVDRGADQKLSHHYLPGRPVQGPGTRTGWALRLTRGTDSCTGGVTDTGGRGGRSAGWYETQRPEGPLDSVRVSAQDFASDHGDGRRWRTAGG